MLGDVAHSLLDAPTEGPQGLSALARVLAASPAFDSCALLVREGERYAIVAAEGIPAAVRVELDPASLPAEVARARRAAVVMGPGVASPPLPAATRAAAAAPILSRGAVLGLAV